MSTTRGAGVIEALAAMAIAAIAVGGIAASALVAVRVLHEATEAGGAVAAAADALEHTRVGEPASGADVHGAAPAYARRWEVATEPGAPAAVRVEVGWGAHRQVQESTTWR